MCSNMQDVRVRQVAGFSLLQAKEEGKRLRRVYNFIRQSFVFVLLIIFTFSLSYTSNSTESYQHNAHVKNMMTGNHDNGSCNRWVEKLYKIAYDRFDKPIRFPQSRRKVPDGDLLTLSVDTQG